MKKATAWILGAAVLMTLAARPGYGQTAQDVLNKMIDAIGGRKALEAIKDTTITGTVEITNPMPITAPITIYQKEPDKVRMDIDISELGVTITQAYDGKKAWSTNPQTGAAEELPEGRRHDGRLLDARPPEWDRSAESDPRRRHLQYQARRRSFHYEVTPPAVAGDKGSGTPPSQICPGLFFSLRSSMSRTLA